MTEREGLRDAATVILYREQKGALEILLLRRHEKSGFFGGAYVFPGGRLESADYSAEMLARLSAAQRPQLLTTPGRSLSESQSLGLYVAACREVFEEAGVLLSERAADFDLREWQDRVRQDAQVFAELLMRVGGQLALSSLDYWAHWITPKVEGKRYDTRFFLAAVPHAQESHHDGQEATAELWCGPKEALSAHQKGEIYLPPPTRYILTELVTLGADAEAWRKAAKQRIVRPILPKVAMLDDEPYIVLPWDPEYPALPGESLPHSGPEPAFDLKITRIPLR